MGYFSNLLTALMDRKGIINNEVIRYTGINRSTFFKIKNGARNPSSPQMVDDIARAMRLNEDDRQALFRAYEVDQVGPYRYYGAEAIKRFCLSDVRSSHRPGVIITIPEFREGEHVRIFREVSEVRAVIMGVLNEKASKVRILENRMSDIYRTGIPQASGACPEKSFYHIFRMNDTEMVDVENQLYNVNCFQSAVETVKRTDMYFPRYYYSPASAYGQSKEQNCFILSDRYLLTYSDNFSSAVLYNEPELLAFYGEVFENRMESSSSLLEQGGSLGIFPEEPWMKLFRAEENEVYFCIPGIGSSFFVGDNEDLFRSYISDTVEEKEELIRFRLSYGDRLQKAVRRLGGSIRIISACNAVERFVREGYINEFPTQLAVPVPKQERRSVLRRWRRAAVQFNMVGTREKRIPDTSSLCIISTEQGAFLSFLSEQERVDARIFVSETSIVSLIFAYMKRVASENIMNNQEYLSFLDNLIDSLEDES